mmetsp:Transcript_26528/g.71752  ORF Transcript_26528/g.71752 Transcript_26528/m.71752 type:complete len:502 (+) Transcript_26528:201-1706(+)
MNGDGAEEGEALLHKRHEALQVALPPSTHEETERKNAQKPLMLSYALAAWAWRSWEFAVALLLIQLSSSSLRLVSAYGLVDNFVRVAFGGSVGGYVGRRCIASGTRNFLLLQNACIAVSAACAAALLGFKEELGQLGSVRWILLVSTIGCGATSSLGSLGIQIAIEKRAIQAMLRDVPSALAEANSGFRAIDLTCQLAAPIVIGLLMTYTSSLTATLMLLAYTMLVWVPEVRLFQRAVHLSQPLRAMSHQEGSQGEKDPPNSAATSSSSSSRSSSSRSSPNTPELLQHRNTIESLSVEPPGKSCPELPRSKGETTERHLAESFSCNGRVEHIHIGSPPSGAATKDRFSTPSGSALAQPGTSAPLAAPCISAPTSTQLPPSLATSGSPGNSCDRKSQDSFVAQAVRDQLEAASESKPSHARSIPCAPEQRSSSSHDPIRSNASLSPTHSIHSHFTRQPSMRRAPSKSQVAGLEVGMNKSGPKVGLRTSAILRTRQSAPGCFY